MGRQPRHQDDETYYFLTNRCHQTRFLMRPDSETRRVILGILARASSVCGVRVVCFCFLSNHFHIVAAFPRRNRDRFMNILQTQISKRVGHDLRDRKGSFWEGRYDCHAILDDAELLEKIAYVVNNPVHHRLVRSAEKWPGVNSIRWHKSGEPVRGKWLNKSERGRLQRKGVEGAELRATENWEFELHLPDALGGKTDEGRRQHLLDLVIEDLEQLEDQLDNPYDVPGPAAMRRQDWRDRPEDPASSPSCLCLTTEPDRRRSYRKRRRAVTNAYREATRDVRNGKAGQFPIGTIPPGWHRIVTKYDLKDPPDPMSETD